MPQAEDGIRTTGEGFHRMRHLWVGGERVSWLHLFDFQMRLGAATVRMGGIGGVATAPEHRRRGYASRVMDDANRLMLAEGFDVALLFGIEDFYYRYGYVPCTPEVRTTVRTRDAARMVPGGLGCRLRPMEPDDEPAFHSLYNSANSGRPMTVVRPHPRSDLWRYGSEFGKRPEALVVEDYSGEFAGYAIFDRPPAPTTLAETECREAEAFLAVVEEMVKRARKRREGEIHFALPSDHILTLMLRRGGCRTVTEYRRTGGPMARIISQDALVAKVAAAADDEQAASPEGEVSSVDIFTNLDSTHLDFPAANCSGTIETTAGALMQVLSGFRQPAEVLASGDATATGNAGAALYFLAPRLEPITYGPDRF